MLNTGNFKDRLNFFREETKVMLTMRPHANIVQVRIHDHLRSNPKVARNMFN